MIFIRSLGRLASSARSSTTLTPAAASKQFGSNKTSSTISNSGSSNSSNNLISIKDSCLNRLKQILEKPDKEFLRIQVETGGCSGFSYTFDIQNNTNINSDEDIIFERDQYRVVLSKDILPYMEGSSIEYTESLIKSSFQVTNPIAETKCSCGSSFSVDLSKLTKKKV